eukprot:4301803-Prymnesium_polylepis.1
MACGSIRGRLCAECKVTLPLWRAACVQRSRRLPLLRETVKLEQAVQRSVYIHRVVSTVVEILQEQIRWEEQ